MKRKNRYTITAALPYANGPLHIGHIAGAYLPADIYVRFRRLMGDEVLFVCGSDEHGVPITLKAKAEGISPQQVVDKYHKLMGDAFKEFGISFDIYSRTSSKLHHKTASDIFLDIYKKGGFTEQETLQYYDNEANQFLADRYIEGTCPRCGYENAYGDQCEKCGTSLSPSDLINPRSKLSGTKPELRSTVNWFLPMDSFQSEIESFIEKNEGFWRETVIGQCRSWLKQGLQPRAMTRDLEWGVPVPIEGQKNKVLYVWFDAPIGYISATKEFFSDKDDPNEWELFWKKQKDPADDARLVHFIGKDNIVFHCIIFPITLLSEGNYILPWQVPANEFLNLEGNKISTSRNWAVWLHEYLVDFPDRQDELRYVLTSIAPETKDSEFTWKDFQARINNELVAILGNFINRVMVLTQKFHNGKIPPIAEVETIDRQLIDNFKSGLEDIISMLEAFKFREAQTMVMDLARNGNKYLAETEPWKLQKNNPERVSVIMHIALHFSALLSSALSPFLPKTAKMISNFFPAYVQEWNVFTQPIKNLELKTGETLNNFELLFKPITDEEITIQTEKLHKTTMVKENIKPIKPEITYDDFSKLDIRVGVIIQAEKVEKADKLLKLTIDIGMEKRTVVSGIAMHYTAEEVIGKQVLLLANLAPRKLRGVDSYGMILMAENNDGKLVFVAPLAETEPGSGVS